MNMKQLCAKEALKYIKDGMCIGLGGGSTIGYLAEYLAKEERKITVVTPSDDTAARFIQRKKLLHPWQKNMFC